MGTAELVDEAKRYMVYSYGEWVGTYDTAAEVWAVIAKWDLDQARVYGGALGLCRASRLRKRLQESSSGFS